jgi:hypothetical protein
LEYSLVVHRKLENRISAGTIILNTAKIFSKEVSHDHLLVTPPSHFTPQKAKG